MTFDYVTVPEGINVDADIYPSRVGRADERVLYGIDPAFIVEACMERRSALGLGDLRKYVLGRGVGRTLPATSGGGIDFLTCIENIRDISRAYNIVGGWLNRDFTFADVGGLVLDNTKSVNLEDVYPGSTITDWASPVEHSDRIIRLDELKACYHDVARMSRALVPGTINHSAWTSVMSGTTYYGEPVHVEKQYPAGGGFGTSTVTRIGSPSGTIVASGMYCKASVDSSDTDHSWSCEGFGDIVYSFEDVDKYKTATALFLLETYEDNGDTSKFYWDIIARPVGKDGSVSFDNSTARSVCLGNRSLQPVKDLEYVLNVNCLEACLTVDLNLKTDISDIGVKTIAEPN